MKAIPLVNEMPLPRHPEHPKFVWIPDFNALRTVLGLSYDQTSGKSAFTFVPVLAARFPTRSFICDIGQWKFIVRNGAIKRRRGRFYPRRTNSHNLVCYVGLYEVSRHYGGPDEGGWWYDWWTYVRLLARCRYSRVIQVMEKFKQEYEPEKKRRYNVHGGPDNAVTWDFYPGQSATLKRPYYE